MRKINRKTVLTSSLFILYVVDYADIWSNSRTYDNQSGVINGTGYYPRITRTCRNNSKLTFYGKCFRTYYMGLYC